MGPRRSKPAFHSVVDLGLRDVGVTNDPRRLAAQFGKSSIRLLALAVLFAFAVCAIVRGTGAAAWVVVPLGLVLTAGLFLLTLRMASRSPVVAVKVSSAGANQAMWLVHAPLLLLVPALVLLRDPLLIPMVVPSAIMAVLLWRGRARVPEVLRELRPLLAEGESVLGDGIGLAPGARNWHDAFRLVVATDRRLIVATSPRSTERFLLVDVPYRRVSGFGIEWKYRGRVGELSLAVDGETQVIRGVVPANLISVARALQSHGVHTDDPAAVFEAERAWEEAQRRGERRERLLDPAAINTRGFDRGLWLLLGLSAVAFYVNPFGVGLGASRDSVPLVLVVPALCAVCAYVSGTRSSLAYLVPLNLFICPAFFFVDASDVMVVMLVLTVLGAVGLWAGSALREVTAGRSREPAGKATDPARPAARGTLRYAISGMRLVRISAALLVAVAALVVIGAAFGFDSTTLRLAIEEATAKQVPVDGRSNLTGNAASLTYTPGPDLHEFITDANPHSAANDGARWELRSSFAQGYNVVSLAHYVFEPRLDDAAAVARFLARKDRDHSRLAGSPVSHTERVVDGRKGYVWSHRGRRGYWFYSAWFPQPIHSVRVECIARRQKGRFKRLCAEAVGSLEFH
jgi:hypothetical protein